MSTMFGYDFDLPTLFATFLVVIIGCYYVWKRKRTTFCNHNTDLHGLVAIVTGANIGIGKETARELARRGARVILACRSVEKGGQAIEDIRNSVPDAEVIVKCLDLSSLASIKRFAENIKTQETCVDIVVHNAGVINPVAPVSVDGYEGTFATNHLGPFLLMQLLLDVMAKSEIKRVVVVSSFMHKYGCVEFNSDGEILMQGDETKKYANTKLMNCLFVQEMDRRLRSKGYSVFVMSPGVVNTNIGHNLFDKNYVRFILKAIFDFWLSLNKTPAEGCQTVLYCAIVPEITHLSGSYFEECQVASMSKAAQDKHLAKKLWLYSESKVKGFL